MSRIIGAKRSLLFLSTPSARRATCKCAWAQEGCMISIHALREEGDRHRGGARRYAGISIHALREEGDETVKHIVKYYGDFYPRPPRGGRPGEQAVRGGGWYFYPRPPRGGRHHRTRFCGSACTYFYPRPPRGGRHLHDLATLDFGQFLSTPSARRATAKTETKALFSNKLYNILHEFRRALIYNGSKSYPNHAK